jgi:hypothetical protein
LEKFLSQREIVEVSLKHSKSHEERSGATIVGQQGINLIERVALEMGFAWNPTNIDVGIDSYMEIRDATSGQATNCIIQVQARRPSSCLRLKPAAASSSSVRKGT